jgi:hypothetical protein
MNRLLRLLSVLLVTALVSAQARAGLISISLVPSVTTINKGENVFVDINVSGLQSDGVDKLLGAWSLGFGHDSRFLVPLGVPPLGAARVLPAELRGPRKPDAREMIRPRIRAAV